MTCPALFENGAAGGDKTKDGKDTGAEVKRVYKPARRRDRPPSKPGESSRQRDGADAAAGGQKPPVRKPAAAATVVEREEGSAEPREDAVAEAPHDLAPGTDRPGGKGHTPAPLQPEESPGSKAPGEDPDKKTEAEPVDRGVAPKSPRESNAEAREDRKTVTGEAVVNPEGAPRAASVRPESASGPIGTAGKSSDGCTVTCSWEGLRVNTLGSANPVPLHARLLAATYAEAGAAGGRDSGQPRPLAELKASPGGTSEEKGRDDDKTVAQAPSPSARRKKSVSFAAGTKESPPSNAVALTGGGGNGLRCRDGSDASAQSTKAGTHAQLPRASNGKQQGKGSRRGRRQQRGGASAKPRKQSSAPSPGVVGEVVEREAASPAQMPRDAINGASHKESHKLVEGHLPRIETDVSFRVLPKGYGGPLEGPSDELYENGGLGAEEKGSVDLFPGGRDVFGGRGGIEDGDEDDEDEDDENDR